MALVSADSRIAELLGELHQLIKQTQEERSRSEHNLLNIQKTHERMQTENKTSSARPWTRSPRSNPSLRSAASPPKSPEFTAKRNRRAKQCAGGC